MSSSTCKDHLQQLENVEQQIANTLQFAGTTGTVDLLLCYAIIYVATAGMESSPGCPRPSPSPVGFESESES